MYMKAEVDSFKNVAHNFTINTKVKPILIILNYNYNLN